MRAFTPQTSCPSLWREAGAQETGGGGGERSYRRDERYPQELQTEALRRGNQLSLRNVRLRSNACRSPLIPLGMFSIHFHTFSKPQSFENTCEEERY